MSSFTSLMRLAGTGPSTALSDVCSRSCCALLIRRLSREVTENPTSQAIDLKRSKAQFKR
jgi:hypothetical protein